MDELADGSFPHPVWVEVEGVVQADHDVDVRLEARGLAIAEMSDVTFAERLMAVQPGCELAVQVRNHDRITGVVVQAGQDFLMVRAPYLVVIPIEAIVSLSCLPRVLHDEPTTTQRVRTVTCRSTLRELLGESMQIDAGGVRHVGRLTWVGADHVTVTSEGPVGLEVTIRLTSIDSVILPAR